RLAAGEIDRGRTEGTEVFGHLAEARILAQQARTDETLQLVTRGDITASEKSFDGHIDDLLARIGDRSPAATEAVNVWAAGHREQVAAYRGGDYPGAVAQALGTEHGGSAAQFVIVESTLSDALQQARTTMRDHMAKSADYLEWIPSATLVL